MRQKVEAIRTAHMIAKDTIVTCLGDITQKEWEEFGLKLIAAEKFVQWYLGYWWNYGHKKWSRKAEAFIEKICYKRETLMVYGSVYNSVKPLIRIKGLSFLHHRLIAPMDETKQKEWLEKANEEGWSVATLRKEIKKSKPKEDLPKDVFNVIYADPPWKYSDELIEGYGAVEHHYEQMTIEELSNYEDDNGTKIQDIFAPEAALFLWVTSPILDECWPVIDAWGFEYKTSFVWDKVKHNYGHYNSVRHEILLVCTKGSFLPECQTLHDSVITLERSSKHSEKPEYFRKLISSMYPKGKKLELFGRKKIHGWTVYGNELQ